MLVVVELAAAPDEVLVVAVVVVALGVQGFRTGLGLLHGLF